MQEQNSLNNLFPYDKELLNELRIQSTEFSEFSEQYEKLNKAISDAEKNKIKLDNETLSKYKTQRESMQNMVINLLKELEKHSHEHCGCDCQH